ncbi:MAG TPA: cation:proton antiporter [Polyangiaceae bacterium]|nr:cation:proton antiporter [Polyangiaceae bacterium]
MTAAGAVKKTLGTRATQLLALLAAGGLLWALPRVATDLEGPSSLIVCVGFLLLAGMLTSELLETLGLPHLTGYIVLGLVAGPHVLGLVDEGAVHQLGHVNTLALTLIALAGGVELRWELLRDSWRTLLRAHVAQTLVVSLVTTAVFFAVAPQLTFLKGFSSLQLFAVSVLWAVLAVSRSPSATLAILAQTHARGPLASFALAFVMSSDILVVAMLSMALSVVRPLFDTNMHVSLSELGGLGHELGVLGHELVGSITLGTTLGLGLAAYLRLFRQQVLLILLGLSFVAAEAIHYLRFDPVLTFLIAGFVVQNLSRQGPHLLKSVERTGSVVFVLFFATAGAHLDVPLLEALWPMALLLCGVRAAATWAAHWMASRGSGTDPIIQRWGAAPLVSQAGLTLGLSVVIEKAFPEFGVGFRSLAIAAVAINELAGPILFKVALDRNGESR